MRFEEHRTDILIVGTGGAGLFAALHAKKAFDGDIEKNLEAAIRAFKAQFKA